MTSVLAQKTRRAFLLVLFTPMLLGVFVLLELRAYHQSATWVAHTNLVLLTTDDVLLAVTRAESAQRGFLITRGDTYAGWCSKAQEDAVTSIEKLRKLTTDNTAQQENARQLLILVSERFRQMNLLMQERRPGTGSSTEGPDPLLQGSTIMQQIWAEGHQITEIEQSLLRKRTQTERERELGAATSFIVCILVNFAVLLWAYRIITSYSREQEQANEQILQLNADLEERVAARTSELETANLSLRQSNEDLTNFAYVASHDLQEPLRTIGSYVGLLGLRYQGKLDDQADKYIQFAVEGAKRMQSLVQDLLIYSRVGMEALQLKPVNLEAVARNVRESLALLIHEQQALVVSDALPVVIGDEGKLTRVLMNLIGNAIKFRKREEPPRISVSARNQGEFWEITIRDNGIGFEQEYAERIFAIFQRLHGVGVYPGTGMGLAICRRIVEQHGGRIWAVSNPGEGSSFLFTLRAYRSKMSI